MIEQYLTNRDVLRMVFILVDFRHAPSQEDISMREFLEYYNIPYKIVMTKADKIPRGKWNKHFSLIYNAFGKPPQDLFLIFSSETGEGVEQAWQWIEAAIAPTERA